MLIEILCQFVELSAVIFKDIESLFVLFLHKLDYLFVNFRLCVSRA